MLKFIKTTVIVLTIAVASVAILVLGTFIGTLLLILAGVASGCFILWFLWMAIRESL